MLCEQVVSSSCLNLDHCPSCRVYTIIKSIITLVDIHVHTSLSIASVNTISYPVSQPLSECSQCSTAPGSLLYSIASDAGSFISRLLTSELHNQNLVMTAIGHINSQPACYHRLTIQQNDK